MRQAVTASIHSADPAPGLAPAATADSAAPAPAPGHCAVAGRRALPHPSVARTGRGGTCLTLGCRSEQEDEYTEKRELQEAPLQERPLLEEVPAALLLRVLRETESLEAMPLEAALLGEVVL